MFYNRIFNEFKKVLDMNDGFDRSCNNNSKTFRKKTEEQIKEKMSDLLKLKIKLTKIIDKEIIGGVIIKINSIMIDNSIKSKLIDFKI